MPPPRIEPATPRLRAFPSNQSAIGADDDKMLKFLQYLFTLRYTTRIMCGVQRDIKKIKINQCLLRVS